MILRILAALALMLAVAGCGGGDPSLSPLNAPADPGAEMRPDLIVADVERVEPGGVVALMFPEETLRGILFVLEERVGDSWAHRYNLSAGGAGQQFEISWHLPDAEVEFPSIGVSGGGPDWVPIPETAEPGQYRICTGNAGDEFCTPIEIVAP